MNSSQNLSIKERSSNFELLRFFSMMFIVFAHFLRQSGIMDTLTGFNSLFGIIIGNGARIGVFCFVLIGTWFLVDAKFKADKVLKLYCQLYFYTFSIMAILLCCHIHVSVLNIIKSIIPFFEFSLWFVSVYIMLILLAPLLQKILEVDRIFLRNILCIFAIIIPIESTIYHKADTWLDHLSYFVFVFLCMGYYKRYLHNKMNFQLNKNLALCIAISIYLGLSFCAYLAKKNIPILYKYCIHYMNEYKSVPCIIISILIFYYFFNLNIGVNKIINTLTKSVLAVYIIHQTPCFYNILWENILHASNFAASKYVIFYIIGYSLLLYLVCITIDLFRLKYIEPLIIQTPTYNHICAKLNSLYYKKESR